MNIVNKFCTGVDKRVEAVLNLPTAALETIKPITKMITGVVATPLKYFAFKYSERISERAADIHFGNGILKSVYLLAISPLNPDYVATVKDEFDSQDEDSRKLNQITGICTKYIGDKFVDFQVSQLDKDSFLSNHVFTRAAFAVSPAIFAVTRAADLALGYIGVAVSVVTLAQSERVNDFTLRQLDVFGYIADLSEAVIGTLNPKELCSQVDDV